MRKVIGAGRATAAVYLLLTLLGGAKLVNAQELAAPNESRGAGAPAATREADLQARVERLEAEVAELQQLLRGNAAAPVAKGGGDEASSRQEAGSTLPAASSAAVRPEVNAAQTAAGLAGSPALTGGAFGPEGSALALATCGVAAFVLAVAAIRRGHLKRPFWAYRWQ